MYLSSRTPGGNRPEQTYKSKVLVSSCDIKIKQVFAELEKKKKKK